MVIKYLNDLAKSYQYFIECQNLSFTSLLFYYFLSFIFKLMKHYLLLMFFYLYYQLYPLGKVFREFLLILPFKKGVSAIKGRSINRWNCRSTKFFFNISINQIQHKTGDNVRYKLSREFFN